MRPPGRPKGEYRSAQHEGTLMFPCAGPPQAGLAPLGGSAAYLADGGQS